jgi:RNAse (barnase) inhibitor barstar
MNAFVIQSALSDADVRGIELLASALEWPCYVVDLQDCLDKPALLERFAGTLMFPSWFGQNWDAFFDCLVDLASARRASGCVIVLRQAAGLRAHAPEALDTALGILEDAAKVWARRNVAMRIFVETNDEARLNSGATTAKAC